MDCTIFIYLFAELILRVDDGSVIITVTTAKLQDTDKNIVWQKKFDYQSKKYNHCISNLEADNGQRLREEWGFATEKTVSDFINHLKGTSS